MSRVLCCGSFVCDLVAAGIPRVSEPGEIIYAPRGIELSVGGHAANVSIDLVQLGHSNVAAAGCMGEDVFGDYIEGELRRRGIDVYAERLGDFRTAKNMALVVEGEDRRFIAELAANTMLSVGYVLSSLDDARPDLFYLGTVGGLRFIDQSLSKVLDAARGRGCTTVVDVVMPEDEGWGHLTEALPLIDVIHCNIRESNALTGKSDPGLAADMLIDGGVGLIAITSGSRGLTAATEDTKLQMPAFKVDSLDPTGAGDAFCAGVIHGLLSESMKRKYLPTAPQEVLKRILLEGAAAGAMCVTAAGATKAVTRDLVDKLVREQGEDIMKAVKITSRTPQ